MKSELSYQEEQEALFKKEFLFYFDHINSNPEKRIVVRDVNELFADYLKTDRKDNALAERILYRYINMIYRTGLKYCVEQPDMQAYVSGIMLKSWNMIKKYNPDSKSDFSTRLKSVIKREGIRLLNVYNQQKSVHVEETVPIGISGEIVGDYRKDGKSDAFISNEFNSVENIVDDKQTIQIIKDALKTLDERDRELICMYYGIDYDSKSLRGIAKPKGRCHQYVDFRIKYALEKLRKYKGIKSLLETNKSQLEK